MGLGLHTAIDQLMCLRIEAKLSGSEDKIAGTDTNRIRSYCRRKVFIFKDRPGREADVLSFFGDRTTVPPLAFSSIIKDMKALLHNA